MLCCLDLQKDSDEVTATVGGHQNTFTQTGLAAGQRYTVTISGELDGQRGTQSSTQFKTRECCTPKKIPTQHWSINVLIKDLSEPLSCHWVVCQRGTGTCSFPCFTVISGPTNLQVIKTSTTSAVVQWEPAQSDIDRYRLTVTPSDGAGTSQEVTVPRDQSSTQIQQLEAGRLYDIVLVAEKGPSRSEPAATQVTPGQYLKYIFLCKLLLVNLSCFNVLPAVMDSASPRLALTFIWALNCLLSLSSTQFPFPLLQWHYNAEFTCSLPLHV